MNIPSFISTSTDELVRMKIWKQWRIHKVDTKVHYQTIAHLRCIISEWPFGELFLIVRTGVRLDHLKTNERSNSNGMPSVAIKLRRRKNNNSNNTVVVHSLGGWWYWWREEVCYLVIVVTTTTTTTLQQKQCQWLQPRMQKKKKKRINFSYGKSNNNSDFDCRKRHEWITDWLTGWLVGWLNGRL